MAREMLTVEAHYGVVQHSILTDYDREVLVHLYQPLIGYAAVSLFFTLWSENEAMQRVDARMARTHLRLTSIMQMTLLEFEQASKRLEAVGLLVTHLNKSLKEPKFTYVLKGPLTPDLFFKHEVLAGWLMNRLGPADYERTRLYFVSSTVLLPHQKNISATFESVFPNPLDPSPCEQKILQQEVPINRKDEGTPLLSFDFPSFEVLLKDEKIPIFLLTSEIREKITQMAALHGLSQHEMRTVVSASRGLDGTIQIDLLGRNAARMSHKRIAKPIVQPTTSKDPKDLSPVDFLREKNRGQIPIDSEINLVTSIQQKYKFPNEVMNAIIEYTLERLNQVLSNTYVERVAASFGRAQIKTWDSAMDFLANPGTKNKKTTLPNKPEESISQENKELLEMDDAEVEAYVEKWLVKTK